MPDKKPGPDKKTGPDKQAGGLAARRAALDILMTILDRNRPLDETLHKSAALRALPTNDRAFARLLIHTVLRRLPEIDALFAAFLGRPLPNNPSELKHLLRIGTAQLIHLKTPPHAAVDTCVSLAESLKNRKFKGLINAVLRKMAARKKSPDSDADIKKLAHLNTPDWLWQCWVDQYGEANASAIGHQHLQDPPLDI
ncbi:MAG: MFS transporter, partial [Proteobacteria bacterium]|nr:MFS transporter [Pseudomonadota bacterium]